MQEKLENYYEHKFALLCNYESICHSFAQILDYYDFLITFNSIMFFHHFENSFYDLMILVLVPTPQASRRDK